MALRAVFQLLIAIALVLGAPLLIVGVSLHCWRRPTQASWSRIHIGDSEQTVRAALGPPLREYDKDNAPSDYYVSGYRRKERPITNKVFIYLEGDLVLYVWLDANDRVEDTFTGPS